MRQSAIDRFQERQRAKLGIIKLESLDDMIKLMLSDELPSARVINPTQAAYIKSDARYKGYMGPAGCAKTTTGVVDIMLKAMLLPGTKWFIARRDYNDLLDTTMRTATDVLNRLPAGTLLDRSKAAPMKWWLKPMVRRAHEDEEPSEITFMGLSDSVGSYEFNGGFIDEVDEVDERFVNEMKGRLRHKPYPSYPDENYSIGMAFNPPTKSHWLYTACTGMDETDSPIEKPWITLFKPQPRENSRNLPKDYYEGMSGMPEELRQRLVDGMWGSTFPGKPVIRQFKRNVHVRQGLTYKGGTLFRWWDFGYNHPACLFAQVSRAGAVQVLREYKGSAVEGAKFVEAVLEKTAEWFPDARVFQDDGDPAVAQKKDTGQMLAVLNEAGIRMRYQRTPFDLSLNMMRSRFEKLTDGEPSLLIDESCVQFIDGLSGGYHFKEDGITPHKGLYDHLIDACRYGLWNMFGATISSSVKLPNSIAYWSK